MLNNLLKHKASLQADLHDLQTRISNLEKMVSQYPNSSRTADRVAWIKSLSKSVETTEQFIWNCNKRLEMLAA